MGEHKLTVPGQPNKTAQEILDELRQHNAARLQAFAQRGIQINGLYEHYVLSLLEHLVGDALVELQLKHEEWTSKQIEFHEAQIEAQQRMQRLVVPGGAQPIRA